MSLWDHVTETRFFNNNGKPVPTSDNASITLVHTEGQHFGDNWFAVSGIGGHQIGQEKTPHRALLWGMRDVISSKGNAINVVFEPDGLGVDGRRYKQKVIIDGEHRATFKPTAYDTDYNLVDLEDQLVVVHAGAYGFRRYASVGAKRDMETIVRKWFEFIPTDRQLKKRAEKEAANERRISDEQVEADRLHSIAVHSEELFDVMVEGKAEFDRMFQDVDMSLEDRHSFIEIINKMNTIIRKTTGEQS